jgi:hypothetical protein
MKNLFFSVMAAVILLSACNQSNNSTTAGAAGSAAVMTFEKQSHDFGKIQTGGIVSYDFKFKNTGSSPLIITDGRATCGCTTPTWPKTPVKPGESGVIHVTFNSTGKQGLQDKQITITANTTPPENVVHLIGEVLITQK